MNRNSRMQESYDLATHTKLDIDFKVSENCLTFIKHTNIEDIRYKFNEKFVQVLESPSVKDLVGFHISDYISNPINSLMKAVVDAKASGILRLEITFYRHSTKKSNQKFFLTHMYYLKELLPNELVYHNSINNQLNLV